MKYLLPLVLLSGCAMFNQPVPVTVPFPVAPQDLQTACGDLKRINSATEKLSEVLQVVTDNYTQYYLCAGKSADWAEWYQTQKKIYDGVK